MLVWQGTHDTVTILFMLPGRTGDDFEISCAQSDKFQRVRFNSVIKRNNKDDEATFFMISDIKVSLS